MWRMRFAYCVTKASNILTVWNTYCFSTAAMVARTCLLHLYVHCLTCFRYGLHCEHMNLSEVTDAENKNLNSRLRAVCTWFWFEHSGRNTFSNVYKLYLKYGAKLNSSRFLCQIKLPSRLAQVVNLVTCLSSWLFSVWHRSISYCVATASCPISN